MKKIFFLFVFVLIFSNLGMQLVKHIEAEDIRLNFWRINKIRIENSWKNIRIIKDLKKVGDIRVDGIYPNELLNGFIEIDLKSGYSLGLEMEGNHRWTIGKVFVIRGSDDQKLYDLHKYIQINKTKKGYFEYAWFMEEITTLGSTGRYRARSNTFLVYSYDDFYNLAKSYDGDYFPSVFLHEFWSELKKLDLRPRVEIQKNKVIVFMYRFSPKGGIYLAQYSINPDSGKIKVNSRPGVKGLGENISFIVKY